MSSQNNANVQINQKGEDGPSLPPSCSSYISKELEQVKSVIQGAKTNINKIQIKPMNCNSMHLSNNNVNSNPIGNSSFVTSSGNGKGVMGFDYRGSINIKKHIINSKGN
jgi:hypothetical protein